MTGPKITLVGAASLVFSVSIVNDISLAKSLREASLALIDVNEQGLGLVERLAKRLTGLRGGGLDVTATTDLSAALDGADFVINAAALGERDLWPAERELARRLDYWPSKGFRLSGLRNTPLTLGIARAMEKYCPDAWLLQQANPMVTNVGAVSRYTKIKVAGFCHGVAGTIRDLSDWMGIDTHRLDVEAVGINHFLFITKWYRDGRDAYDELIQWNEDRFPAVWETDRWMAQTDVPGPISRDLCRRFGAFPCNGDEHMSDYFAWYTNSADARAKFRAKIDYLDRHIARGNDRWRQWSSQGDASDEELAGGFAESSDEAAVPVIEALCVPGQSHMVHAILPNRGCVEGLPDDSAVEVPAVVTTDDIRPIGPQRLAMTTGAHIARRLAEEELQMQRPSNRAGNSSTAPSSSIPTPTPWIRCSATPRGSPRSTATTYPG